MGILRGRKRTGAVLHALALGENRKRNGAKQSSGERVKGAKSPFRVPSIAFPNQKGLEKRQVLPQNCVLRQHQPFV